MAEDKKVGGGGKLQDVDKKQRYAKEGKNSTYNSQSDPARTLSERVKKATGKDEQTVFAIKKPTAYGFANKERKNTKHHQRHARGMGYKNQDEYERAAVDFFNGNQGKLYYSERRERFYRYDENTQKIAVCDSEGTIHTFDLRTPKEFEKIIRQDMLNET